MRNFDIIYRVERGDTLSNIASKFDVPINLIARENNISGEIYEGQRLIIGSVNGTVYTVKPSDSLEDIAIKFGISKEQILKDNDCDMLFPFMTIVINNKQ